MYLNQIVYNNLTGTIGIYYEKKESIRRYEWGGGFITGRLSVEKERL